MITKIKKLFGDTIEPLRLPRPPQPPAPRCSISDPRHWTNAGWHRSDLPTGRRARRIVLGDPPRAAPRYAQMTGAQFTTGGTGHVSESYVAGVASAARPSLPRAHVAARPVGEQGFVARLR